MPPGCDHTYMFAGTSALWAMTYADKEKTWETVQGIDMVQDMTHAGHASIIQTGKQKKDQGIRLLA